MKFKAGIYACVAVALLSVVAWVATGAKFATRWQCQVSTCTENKHCYSEGEDPSQDERVCKDGKCHSDFGVDNPPQRWETCYEFGLTPNNYVDGVLPISGTFIGFAGLLFFLGRRRDAA